MSFKTSEFVISADLADAGTFTVNYPTGTNRGDFEFAMGHYMTINGTRYNQPEDIGLSFGTSSVTVTNRSGGTIPATGRGFFNFARLGQTIAIKGRNGAVPVTAKPKVTGVDIVAINLGAPATAVANGICTSQAGTAATAMTINGSLASGGVATFDVPRNVVGAWTNTATLTVTGTDEYGKTLVETSASGTSMAGVKAFKTITSVVPSANITGATVGSGDVLGLPIHVPKATTGYILKELQDDAVATAGTVVAGLARNTESTATTADVRGTYDPNAACDGARSFTLIAVVPDPEYQGNPQFAG